MEFCAIVFLLHVFGRAEETILISWDVIIHFFCFLLQYLWMEFCFSSIPRYFMDRVLSFRKPTSVSTGKLLGYERCILSFIYTKSLIFPSLLPFLLISTSLRRTTSLPNFRFSHRNASQGWHLKMLLRADISRAFHPQAAYL